MEDGGEPALAAGASRRQWLEEEGGEGEEVGRGGLASAVNAFRPAGEAGRQHAGVAAVEAVA